MKTQIALAALALLLGSLNAAAQNRMMTELPEARSAEEITRQLMVQPTGPEPTEVSVALQVPFDFGSAQLRPDGMDVLDLVAQSINDPGLMPYRFLVEGHTDAVGGEEYNLRLSRQRATAAHDYLIRRGVDPARLQIAGYGELRPIPGTAGEDARNRRVEIVRLP